MIHYKGDERVLYEACKSVVDGMAVEDKVMRDKDPNNHVAFTLGLWRPTCHWSYFIV